MSEAPADPWQVVLIVEDDTDGRALRRLAEATRLPVQVDWLYANGIGNIKRRTDGLIALAQDRIVGGRGCVAVVVDRDGKDQRRDEPHRSIAAACAAQSAAYIEAVESMEAWLLADDGIVAWLGLRARTHTDSLSTPRDILARAFLRKTRRSYRSRRARVQLAGHATGVNPSRSASWSRALSKLDECVTHAG